MYLGFGFNAHNSNFTKEFDVGLKFFLLVSDKRIWAKLCLSAVLSRPGLRAQGVSRVFGIQSMCGDSKLILCPGWGRRNSNASWELILVPLFSVHSLGP